jgi:predicted nucleic acid-binding protein
MVFDVQLISVPTEDLQDGWKIGSLRVWDPFKA